MNKLALTFCIIASSSVLAGNSVVTFGTKNSNDGFTIIPGEIINNFCKDGDGCRITLTTVDTLSGLPNNLVNESNMYISHDGENKVIIKNESYSEPYYINSTSKYASSLSYTTEARLHSNDRIGHNSDGESNDLLINPDYKCIFSDVDTIEDGHESLGYGINGSFVYDSEGRQDLNSDFSIGKYTLVYILDEQDEQDELHVGVAPSYSYNEYCVVKIED